jgi:hypothetical protein
VADPQKNELKPWLKAQWCIPPDASGEFVWHMEDVLDVYRQPYDPRFPQVCLDEASKQLVGETRTPVPARPGHAARVDYEYARRGTAALFLACEPPTGWRHVWVDERRTRVDWAHVIKDLVDVYFPDAERLRLVMDQLNTHTPGSLYEAFPPPEAKRLADKLELHYTPKHGSWPNIAEIELSVLARQCLDQRIDALAVLRAAAAAWEARRNAARTPVDWRFTAADARVKLKHLYPAVST